MNMFRSLLVIYLLLLTLAGPSPCCCTLARFVAMSMSRSQADGQDVEFNTCCHRHIVDVSHEDKDGCPSGQPSRSSNGPTQGCKCQKNVCAAAPEHKTHFTVELNRSWLDGIAGHLDHTPAFELSRVIVDEMSLHETLDSPRTGREIRIEIHSWRC